MKSQRKKGLVQPKDKPTTYNVEPSKEVDEDIHRKKHQNPQQKREEQEYDPNKLERDPGK